MLTNSFDSKFEIRLSPKDHGMIAHYAVKNHMMMDEAVKQLFEASLYMLERQLEREAQHA